jgi:hypothetical protein
MAVMRDQFTAFAVTLHGQYFFKILETRDQGIVAQEQRATPQIIGRRQQPKRCLMATSQWLSVLANDP